MTRTEKMAERDAAAAVAPDAAVRGADGRFRPGRSGNPAGKKKGTRNRATILAELMREGERAASGRVVIEAATGGDLVAAKFLFPWLYPKPRGRTLDLDLPEGRTRADVAEAYDRVQAALCAGEITIDEALAYARFIDARAAALAGPKEMAAGTARTPAGKRLTEQQRLDDAFYELKHKVEKRWRELEAAAAAQAAESAPETAAAAPAAPAPAALAAAPPAAPVPPPSATPAPAPKPVAAPVASARPAAPADLHPASIARPILDLANRPVPPRPPGARRHWPRSPAAVHPDDIRYRTLPPQAKV